MDILARLQGRVHLQVPTLTLSSDANGNKGIGLQLPLFPKDCVPQSESHKRFQEWKMNNPDTSDLENLTAQASA